MNGEGKERGTLLRPLMATAVTAALLATTSAASAGGFAIREQSAEFQGMSFAGNAAGGAISAMFWNPAATANREGTNTESSMSAILAYAKVTVMNSSSGDIGPPAFVPSSYGTYQISKNVYIGMAVNAPFGTRDQSHKQ